MEIADSNGQSRFTEPLLTVQEIASEPETRSWLQSASHEAWWTQASVWPLFPCLTVECHYLPGLAPNDLQRFNNAIQQHVDNISNDAVLYRQSSVAHSTWS